MSEYKRPSFFEAPLGYVIAPVILYLLFFYLSDQMRLVLIASVVGALLGCFTGLVPGIHANTIAILLFSLTIAIEESLGFLSETIDVKILIVVAIASTSISHTFLNFIPGTVLGAPEENNALGVLPMHEMIMRKPIYQCKCKDYIYFPKKHRNKDPAEDFKCPECGRSNLNAEENIIEKAPGYLAIYYSAVGSLYAAIFCILLVIPLKLVFGRESLAEERGYDIAKDYMLWILLVVTLILIFTDRARLKKFKYHSKGKTYSFYGFKESQVDWRLKDKEKKLLGEMDLGWQGRAFGLVAVVTVFLLSGAFGWVVLNQIEGTADSPFNPFLRDNYGFYLPATTLFPAFTGLFGIATLMFSISTTPKYSQQNLGVKKPKYKNLIDLEKNIIYADLSGYRLGGLRDWLLSWFSIRKVPRFQCRKCDLYYDENEIAKCKCGEEHKIEAINYSNSVIGAISGSGAGLLPGVTAGIGTIIAMFFKNSINTIFSYRNKDERDYTEDNDFAGRSEDVIMTLAAVNTAASLTILAGLFIILRPRNGTTIVIDQMVTVEEWIQVDQMPLVLTCLLISVLVSIIIGFVFTATTGVKAMEAIIYLRRRDPNFAPKAMKFMIVALFVLVWIFTGIIGVVVMLVATFIGLLPPLLGIRKSHAMGFLLVPVMIFYYNMSGSGLFT